MKPLSINPQVLNVKESATLAINQRVKALRKEGKTIYHFGFGQSPFPVPEIIQKALQDNSDKKDYLPTQGLPELTAAVSKFYSKEFGYEFTSDFVCIGPGSKELIFQIVYLLEGPLLIPAPSWVSYGPQAAIRGKKIVPILTKRENGYRLQAEELDEICHRYGEIQKILIFNNPNNPTGGYHTESEIKEIAEICRAYHVIAICDEIYSLLNYSGHSHYSIAHYYPEGTIVTGGLSKAFSAGGYRLGIIMIPPTMDHVLQALKSLISETFSAVSTPIQYAGLAAYESYEKLRSEIEKCTSIHQFTGEYLHQRFVNMHLNCPKPEGGFYLFPDFNNYGHSLKAQGIITSAQIANTMLQEANVAFLPASDFYLPATNLGVRVASVDYDGEKVLNEFPGIENMTPEATQHLFPNLVKGCDQLETFLKQL
ncbi:MAG: aminotransferase class I/II-fold pyridoxal phosphate-dependent enzyme [SAR324 cluster bacterium]|nr:aminotransferase class I/II-fold pyridoxal phosphate-dependent enzyme [SAR324 cluster bacterium]